MRVLITTIPFADKDAQPLHILEQAGAEVIINPLGRKLTEADLAEIIVDVDILIAGTEPITEAVLERAAPRGPVCRSGTGNGEEYNEGGEWNLFIGGGHS